MGNREGRGCAADGSNSESYVPPLAPPLPRPRRLEHPPPTQKRIIAPHQPILGEGRDLPGKHLATNERGRALAPLVFLCTHGSCQR
ncbi:hypothetical protein NN561_002210 [Cricetulus griseus]